MVRSTEHAEDRAFREALVSEYVRLGEYGMALTLLHHLQQKRYMVEQREKRAREAGRCHVADAHTREWIRLDKAVSLAGRLLREVEMYKETDALFVSINH